MTDPARKNALSADDIEQLARTADWEIVQAFTPGARRASRIEWLLILALVFVAGTALYVHLDIVPFLPITLSPSAASLAGVLAFCAMSVSGILLLAMALSYGYGVARVLRYRWFPPTPYVICLKCGTRTVVTRYIDGPGCKECGSREVRCARCKEPASIELFMTGLGCPSCSAREISVEW